MKKRNSKSIFNKSSAKKIFRNKFMSNEMIKQKILNNKITLYLVSAISLFSLYIYITTAQLGAIILFFFVGALMYNYTKHMTIVLGTAFIVTGLASMLNSTISMQEGLGNKEGAEDIDPEEEVEEVEDVEEDPTTASPSASTTASTSAASKSNVSKKPKMPKDPKMPKMPKDPSEETDPEKEAFNDKLNPALYDNIPNVKNMQKQLGKASEIEQAYDNMEKIIGKDNVQSISSETKDLIKQQNELIKQLKTMTPALNGAMASLGNIDLGKLTGMFNSATQNLTELKNA
jgi:hypothetical protein